MNKTIQLVAMKITQIRTLIIMKLQKKSKFGMLRKRIRNGIEIKDMSSSSDSLSSIVETNAKNRWLTPEREEIFKKLPRTVFGL